MTKSAIIYNSSTGHAYQWARVTEEGAGASGAEVRVRKVRETASAKNIAAKPGWNTQCYRTNIVRLLVTQ